MTFHEWYQNRILPRLHDEQQPYESESVAFREIDQLSKEEALQLFMSMTESEQKLALFDHVKSCMHERWDPTKSIDGFDEE